MARSLTDPLTGRRYLSRQAMLAGIERDNHAQLQRAGVTAAQVDFNRRNGLPLLRAEGRSALSGRPTAWCERACRYERFADDAERRQYRAQFLERMRRAYGVDHLLGDPDRQRSMLAARSISGTYAFGTDGAERRYVGSYELDYLRFMDQGLGWPGADVWMPAPQNFRYRGPDGLDHWFLPDSYVETLNLVVEVKGEMESAAAWRNRDIEIERCKDAALGTSGYNYAKVVGKDYGPLVEAIARIKGGES